MWLSVWVCAVHPNSGTFHPPKEGQGKFTPIVTALPNGTHHRAGQLPTWHREAQEHPEIGGVQHPQPEDGGRAAKRLLQRWGALHSAGISL